MLILGLDEDCLSEICRDIGKPLCSGCKSELSRSGCTSGVEGLKLAAERALEKGAKRVVPLKVSGPFHTELMAPAAERLKEYIEDIEINDISVPVISNHRSEPVYKAADIKTELVEQLTHPVRFADNVRKASQMGVDTLVEMSPKAVVGPMARRTLGPLKISLATPGGI